MPIPIKFKCEYCDKRFNSWSECIDHEIVFCKKKPDSFQLVPLLEKEETKD